MLTGEAWKPKRTFVDSWSRQLLQCSQDTKRPATCSSRYHIEVPSACRHTWWRENAEEICCPNSLCNVKHERRNVEVAHTKSDGFTDCFGTVETLLIMTTWRRYWPKKRSNQCSIQRRQLSTSATFSNSGLGCLTWAFNFLQCLVDGGQTLTVASQDWKNRSGFTAVHVDLPTPSTRSEIAPGKHTFHQSKMRWWQQFWERQEFSTCSCKRRSPECRYSQQQTTMIILRWLKFHQAMKRWTKLTSLKRRPRRLRREALELSRLREKLMPEVMTSKLGRMKRTWGANPRRRRSAKLRYGTSVIDLRSWLPMHRMFSIASFVVECMTLMSAPHRMTRTWETHCGAWDWSWMKSQNPHLLRKDPKLRQEAEKTSSRRTSCHRGNDGEEPDSLRRRKWPNASTASQPSCTTLVTVKKEVNS